MDKWFEKPLFEAIYRGKRVSEMGGQPVTVNGKGLPLRLDIVDHSPDGFLWGYGGSGPAQTAVAILADYFERQAKQIGGDLFLSTCFANHFHQDFKWDLVAHWKGDWILNQDDVFNWLMRFENKFDEIYKAILVSFNIEIACRLS